MYYKEKCRLSDKAAIKQEDGNCTAAQRNSWWHVTCMQVDY